MQIRVPELPFPLSWSPAPESWADKEGVLTVAAGPRTDLFTSPEDGSVRAEAPLLLGSYRGEFQFSALVAPAFGAAFDAGALIVREGPDRWRRFRRPAGTPSGALRAPT